MTNSTVAKNAMVAAWAAGAVYAEASSSVAGATAGTALSGVARVAVSWSAPSGGAISATVNFTGFTAGQTFQSVNFYSAATGGTFFDTLPTTAQSFSVPGATNTALAYSVS